MRVMSKIALASAVLFAAGCSTMNSNSGPEMNAGYGAMRSGWNATLVTPSELAGVMQLHGSAHWIRQDDNTSTVQVMLSNATSGGMHPWHVHYGRCGGNGGIVGSASAYPVLSVGSDGMATAKATLPMAVATTGEYYVNVHASSSNMGTIVACGNLAAPVQ